MRQVSMVFICIIGLSVFSDDSQSYNINRYGQLEYYISVDKSEYIEGQIVFAIVTIVNLKDEEAKIEDLQIVLETISTGKKGIWNFTSRSPKMEMIISPGKNHIVVNLNTSVNVFQNFKKYYWPITPAGDYELYLAYNGYSVSNSVNLKVQPVDSSNIEILKSLEQHTIRAIPETRICTELYDRLSKYKDSIYEYEFYYACVADYVLPIAVDDHNYLELIHPAKNVLKEYLELRDYDYYAHQSLKKLKTQNKNFEQTFIDSLWSDYNKRKNESKFNGAEIQFHTKTSRY